MLATEEGIKAPWEVTSTGYNVRRFEVAGDSPFKHSSHHCMQKNCLRDKGADLRATPSIELQASVNHRVGAREWG